MDTLEIRRGERCQEFELLDAEFTVGSGDDDRLRIKAPGITPCMLRFVRGEVGFRVESVESAATFRLNGVDVAKRELRHGDRIECGSVTIAYREEGKPWPVDPEPVRGGLDLKIGAIPTTGRVAPAAPRRSRSKAGAPPRAASGRRGKREVTPERERETRKPLRRRTQRPWLLWNLLLVVGVLAFVLIRTFGTPGTNPAGDLVDLAESQHRNLDHARALATLDAAEEKSPDAPLQARIRALRTKIQAEIQRLTDLPAIRAAVASGREIERFVEIHLAAGPSRPAARELIRLADAWRAEYGRTADRSEDVAASARSIDALRARSVAAAQLTEPDSATDVLFSAERLLRFERRRYVEAFGILEAWLAANPDSAPDRETVRARLDQMPAEGVPWFAARRAAIERMVDRKEFERAITELRAYVAGELVPADWLGDTADRLRQLEAGRR